MSDFWIGFIVGGFICGCLGFLGAAIFGASGRASREEERISDEAIYEATKREEARRGGPEVEVITQNDPRTD